MPKVLEDSLSNLEYLMQALTLLGVVYLVMKAANLKVDVSKEGYSGASLGFNSSTSASNGPRYDRQGFSMGAMEAPVWNMTPYDASEMNQQRMVMDEQLGDDSTWEDGAGGRAANFAPVAGSGRMLNSDNLAVQGFHGAQYTKARQGMMNAKLEAAMAGVNASM